VSQASRKNHFSLDDLHGARLTKSARVFREQPLRRRIRALVDDRRRKVSKSDERIVRLAAGL